LGRYARARRPARRSGRRLGLAQTAVLAALVPLASGCGVLGGLSSNGLGAPQALTVTSPVFGGEEKLPVQYTCHGAGLSPPLIWSGALSQRAKSFAVVVDDSEAPITPYVYWLVFDISASTTAIGQNQLPTGARQAMNSKETARYNPPCPRGDSRGYHLYRFTVYALNVAKLRTASGLLPAGAPLRATWMAIAGHVIAAGRLTVRAYP
jgi:Raf kinase inhibitor-like YbhB/YbcL family protein